MSRGELPRNENGEKMYPICNWERNQHKLYYMSEQAQLKADESRSAEDYDEADRIDRLVSVFDDLIIDGTVYAVWADGLEIKDLIHAYDTNMMNRILESLEECDIPSAIGWEVFEA